jgi:putative acetyltransferase
VSLDEDQNRIRIRQGDFTDQRVLDLLLIHLTKARAETVPGKCARAGRLCAASADISFWTIWEDEELVEFGALKQLSPNYGEVKSMHTVQSKRRRGLASAMLRSHERVARRALVWRLAAPRHEIIARFNEALHIHEQIVGAELVLQPQILPNRLGA